MPDAASGTPAWGPAERDRFFRPWWRAAITLSLAVPPIALTPYFAENPDVASWLGPLSIGPFVVWLALGMRRGSHRRTIAGGASPLG